MHIIEMKIGYLVLSVTVTSAPIFGALAGMAVRGLARVGVKVFPKIMSAAKFTKPAVVSVAATEGLSEGAKVVGNAVTKNGAKEGGKALMLGLNSKKILAAGTIGAIGGAGLSSLGDSENSDNTAAGIESVGTNVNSDNSNTVGGLGQDPAISNNLAEGPIAG